MNNGALESFEAIDPLPLKCKHPPDAADHALAQPAGLDHHAGASAGGIRRHAIQGQPYYNSFDLCVAHAPT